MEENEHVNDFIDLANLYDLNENLNILPSENFDKKTLLNIGDHRLKLLNETQKEIADKIIHSVLIPNTDDIELNDGECLFINGVCGSGKTFLYKTIWYILNGHGKKICTMAFTGIAATILPNGKTVHKIFKLPVPLNKESTADIKYDSKEPKYVLDIMNQNLQDIMNNDLPFGGETLLLSCDFKQLLPVKTQHVHKL